jgi:hypothetical protein
VSLIAVVTAVGLALALLLNLVATAFIVHSECGSAIQKAIQLIITWGIPFVGSIIVVAVLKARLPRRKRGFDSLSWKMLTVPIATEKAAVMVDVVVIPGLVGIDLAALGRHQ